MANSNLHSAKRAKNDEFYTQLSDIEQELKHYWGKIGTDDEVNPFRDKVVFLNCDDPQHSNFWIYFSRQFDYLGIKELISTHYRYDGGSSYMMVLDRDEDGNPIDYGIGYKNTPLGKKIPLQGNGDFRSEECVDLLKRSDIVVTNPPFSLFREYVAQLVKYEKKFLIIGNQNAFTYREIFPLIKENKLWLGYGKSTGGNSMWFTVPDDYPVTRHEKVENGQRLIPTTSKWFTNLDHPRRHEELLLVQEYAKKPWEYPKYDNYRAIEVSEVKHIPCDYDGIIGVPITFLNKYNPAQFEIVGCSYQYGDPGCHIDGTPWGCTVKGENVYKRIFIRRKDD